MSEKSLSLSRDGKPVESHVGISIHFDGRSEVDAPPTVVAVARVSPHFSCPPPLPPPRCRRLRRLAVVMAAPVVPPQRRLSGQLLRCAAPSGRRRWLTVAVGLSERPSSALPPLWHRPVSVDGHAPHRFLSGTGPPRRRLPIAGRIDLRRLSPAGGPGQPSVARGSAPGAGEK